MRTFLFLLSMMAFYALLSGQFHDVYLMTCGVVAALAITALARHLDILDREGMPFEYWLRSAVYAPWLFWQIVISNVDVARLVWSRDLDISPRMVPLTHQLQTSYAVTVYVNSITLTPGTVTVDADEDEILVHALTKGAAEGLLSGAMHDRVRRIEGGP